MYARQPFVMEHNNCHRHRHYGSSGGTTGSSPRLDNWFAQPTAGLMSKSCTAESHRSFAANARGTGAVTSHYHHHTSDVHCCSGDDLERRPYYNDIRTTTAAEMNHHPQHQSQKRDGRSTTPHRFVRVSQAFPHVLPAHTTAHTHAHAHAGGYEMEASKPEMHRRGVALHYNNGVSYGCTPPAGPMTSSPALLSVSTGSPLMIKVPSSDSSISHTSDPHSCAVLSSSRTPTLAGGVSGGGISGSVGGLSGGGVPMMPSSHVLPMDVSDFDRLYYCKNLKSSRLGQRFCGAEITKLVCDFLTPNCCNQEECLPGIGESVMSDISQHNWYPYFTRGYALALGKTKWHELLANTRIFVECEPLLLIARRCLTVNEMFNVKADFSQLFSLLIPDKEVVGDEALISYLRGCLKPISSTTRSFFQDVVFFDGLQCARGFPLILPLMRKCIGNEDMWKEFVMAASEQLAVFEAMRWTKVPSVEYLNTLVPSEMTRDDPFFWTSQCRSADGLTLLEHCYHMDRHFSRFETSGGSKSRAAANPRVAVVKEWLNYSVITAMRLSATQ